MRRVGQPLSIAAGTNVALFDLDGTLTNSKTGICRCIEHALSSMGSAGVGPAELDAWIGPPLHASFEAHLGSRDAADRALALYRERFARVGLFENEVYAGIESALSEFTRNGWSLWVATSKPQVFAARIVDHFGLDRYFSGVYGSELTGERSDKSELIAYTLDRESLDPAKVTMIGDRRHDIIGARRNGVRSVGVLWGFGSRDELNAAGADRLCEAVGSLPDTVMNG